MELVHELFLTVSLAFILSLLVAKLVSMAMAAEAGLRNSQLRSSRDQGEEIVMEEIRFGEGLTVPVSESETKLHELFEEEAPEKVYEFEGESGEAEDIVRTMYRGACRKYYQRVVCMKKPMSRSSRRSYRRKIWDSETPKKNLENRVGLASAAENEVVADSEEIRRVVLAQSEDKEVSFDSDEDDWEGIERSELEKAFAEAAKFVLELSSAGNEDRLAMAGVGSDLQMKLYGLHKIATEGPCRDSRPMALKLSARAKWNSWQRLGQMSPEVAMEQYIKLLSDRVPGWMEGKFAGDIKPESSEAGISSSVAFDLSTSSHHQPNDFDERKPEQKTGTEGGDSTAGSYSEYKAKE
ncbi:LOW QUALITY PROTEIN: acyl-CoA-binding domain-containing protein 3-like [Juglans microcarpa x Juglans regia]|uniref:LOW QUALITY PROTEIN: acyl-CoA-binding domain-containing protein 3-like n=1 Tax=Juglans microcarpa x Juglans regia TaxID=2249226 RepID=UPI001B7F6B48|nr:LOW QUALITY PROTEIN: acyl-CoA-binding domain-containing protein 3-like [Juglans microcarpa x Juglans regia]